MCCNRGVGSALFPLKAYKKFETQSRTQIANTFRVVMAATRFFLPEIKSRVGKCIMFGVKEDQTQYAAQISRLVSERWKNIVVGEEGYVAKDGLTDKVRWGEMVSSTPWIGTKEGTPYSGQSSRNGG